MRLSTLSSAQIRHFRSRLGPVTNRRFRAPPIEDDAGSRGFRFRVCWVLVGYNFTVLA